MPLEHELAGLLKSHVTHGIIEQGREVRDFDWVGGEKFATRLVLPERVINSWDSFVNGFDGEVTGKVDKEGFVRPFELEREWRSVLEEGGIVGEKRTARQYQRPSTSMLPRRSCDTLLKISKQAGWKGRAIVS